MQPINSVDSLKPDQIVAALVRAGLSQEEIAAGANVTQPTVSRIFSGKHKDPRYSVVEKLRDLLRKVGAGGTAQAH
jgi:predicted transcriptional regulator